MIKVGDTIYRFDQNRRRYRRDENGRAMGPPIYAEYFEPNVISGETAQSWLITEHGCTTRVNKKTMYEAGKNGFSGFKWFTSDGMEESIWASHYRSAIVRMVEAADVPLLKDVAKLAGFSPDSNTETG